MEQKTERILQVGNFKNKNAFLFITVSHFRKRKGSMKIKFVFFIFLFCFFLNVKADVVSTSKDPLENVTIPVMPNTLTVANNNNHADFMASVKGNNAPTQISAPQIAKFIKDIKSTACYADKHSTVKVWISFDASLKAFGVGTSSNAGMEVTFNCDHK